MLRFRFNKLLIIKGEYKHNQCVGQNDLQQEQYEWVDFYRHENEHFHNES